MNARIRTRIPTQVTLAVAVVLAAPALTSCGDGAPAPSSTPSSVTNPSTSPRSGSTGSIVGRYTFQIGSDHFDARLGADGSARIYVEGELDAAGTFEVDGSTVTVLDKESGVGDFCAGPGTYRWSLTGDRLEMTLIDEECPGRTELWTAGWTRVA